MFRTLLNNYRTSANITQNITYRYVVATAYIVRGFWKPYLFVKKRQLHHVKRYGQTDKGYKNIPKISLESGSIIKTRHIVNFKFTE